ncbi:MafI family immunity protein [Actinokineospora xionganensis]|uniref:MafI family immunity protein n=1 Tax=Actinokineospora xionganensis TaxID=2684470 RepID=A0ABR7LCH0_9PSEU|nr:MafI family immunity protein [Actinokineospora xionganensis]MBC6449992.1 MafI family immunity protein [Actinokineospora xionganensis]
MDASYYEEITGIPHGLTIWLSDRLAEKDLAWTAEFLDANELGLALEQIADALSEHERPITPDERADMLALADRMQMDDRVFRALTICPDAESGRSAIDAREHR